MAGPKMTKNQMRRAKRKDQKKTQAEASTKPNGELADNTEAETTKPTQPEEPTDPAELAIKKGTSATEATPADDATSLHLPAAEDDPAFSMYKDIFLKFGVSRAQDEVEREANAGNQGEAFFGLEDDIPSEDESGEPKLSKKKRKQFNKLSIAELKALVRKPEVVEWHDVSSTNPRLLVQIKATRNVVPVPSHWSLKREYLSSKRGVEKPPFKLPKFISETGITEMRDAILEKQEQQTLKQKQRERVNPKMGRLDIDYQKLYDAFFRFQTKPELTRYGEVYYEGKEWETDFRHFRPGDLSDALKDSLSIPPGAPAPWLINQQRFGPPPSYPNLKIPGLNAPPPAGAQWGFHPGGYGKPPVDEFNRPLFGGDIFGIAPTGEKDAGLRPQGEPVVKSLWGELQPREEDSESEEEDSEDESGDDEDEEMAAGGLQTPAGTATGFISTVPTDFGHGVETSIAGDLDLRKSRPTGIDTEDSTHPRSAYTVIPERVVRAEGFFGSDRVYDLKNSSQTTTTNNNNNNITHTTPTTTAAGVVGGGATKVLGQQDDESKKRKKPGDIEVSLDPDQLAAQDGMSKEELKKRYEEGKKEDGVGAQWSRPYEDDLSQMIAQESRKRQKRDEEKRSERKKEGKYKF